MALQRYNHTVEMIMNGTVNWDEVRLILLTDPAVFDPSHTTQNQVTSNGAWDVDGNGWDVGGVKLPNFHQTLINTDEGMADFDDISRWATGGQIGPTMGCLISDGVYALFFQNFGTTLLAPNGTEMRVYVNVNGLYRIVDP